MRIEPLPLPGAAIVQAEAIEDSRGRFLRLFCQNELAQLNGHRPIRQVNHSLTRRRGTIRGLHFQFPPCAEDKMVRCLRGRAFDVMVDLRAHSPTFRQWAGIELDGATKMVYIPKGFAHGFQTLTDGCEMLYLHTEFHSPQHEGGFRYDDPAFAIGWPLPPADLSERDRNLPVLGEGFEGIQL